MESLLARLLVVTAVTVAGVTPGVTASSAQPLPPGLTGVLDGATWDGAAFTLNGWAVNGALSNQTVDIHVYDTSAAGTVGRPGFRADQSRSDVAAAFGIDDRHGFSISIPLTAGAHHICVYGIDARPGGANLTIGCRDATIGGMAPLGTIDDLGGGGNAFYTTAKVHISGWAYDPDQPRKPLDIHVYDTPESNGSPIGAAFSSTVARSDVAQAFPGVGAAQGFDINVDLSDASGRHRICVYAIGVGGGDNALLTCRVVTVVPPPVNSVIGVLDSVRATGMGQVTLSGWAIDTAAPQSAATVTMIGMGGPAVGSTQLIADQSRPDVGAAYPGAGDNHGFVRTVLTYPYAMLHVCVTLGFNQSNCRDVYLPGAECQTTLLEVADGVLTVNAYARDPFNAQSELPVIVWLQRQGGEVVSYETVSTINQAIHYQTSAASLTPGAVYSVFIQPAAMQALSYSGKTPGSWCAVNTFVA